MGIEFWLTLAILVGATVLFVSEKLQPDVVAILVLISLLGTGVLSPNEALSGFSSPATITVAAMFVLSAGLKQSGALRGIGDALAGIRWTWLLALTMMLLVATISAFVNNTAAVAVFLPIVATAAVAHRQSPSKFLIPLSFAAQFGGVCTLVGTSTNLVVDSLARQSGAQGFSLFEFTQLGVVFAVVGVTYLMLARHFLLPDLGVPAHEGDEHRGHFLVELRVGAQSPAVGRHGAQLLPSTDWGELLDIIRDSEPVREPQMTPVRSGDHLILRATWPEIERLRSRLRLEHIEIPPDLPSDARSPSLLVEVMVAPGSPWIGHSLSSGRFGHVYLSRVQGMQRSQRHGRISRQPLDRVPLMAGDILMLDAPLSALQILRADPGLVVMSQRAQPKVDRRRAAIALGILAAVILVAGFGWLPIVTSALLGCVALIVTRCLTTEEAYAAIDWRVVILLAGLLPLGLAMQASGGADWLAQHVNALSYLGPHAVLAALYLFTAILTELMSNNAAAALVVPVALSCAEALGVDAKPMLVAVAFAASTSFATPVGYQTNTMVYTAGGYRFVDFLKIGVPLNLIFWCLATILIPHYFPF
ncbi:SLC13 family permease [Lysobacter niastensis]|uniref:SLC13 family permease n=1 Tax=Lysobacter niastensis TaxID=380629 RepID=A0ABS0BB61_9GAMM|nr:SLC13 family permease [Lysobacter niastensis]MBF6024912.1 SLC13 family permease [Lysobacter niastensis]